MTVSRRAAIGGAAAGAAALASGSWALLGRKARAATSNFDLGPLPGVLSDIDRAPHGILIRDKLGLALVRYEPAPEHAALHKNVTAGGVLALRNRCTHLGCSLPKACAGSGWLECACHGARFNRCGDYEFGPAPRGLDRFRLTLRREPNGAPPRLLADLTHPVVGLARGTISTYDGPHGPYCVSG